MTSGRSRSDAGQKRKEITTTGGPPQPGGPSDQPLSRSERPLEGHNCGRPANGKEFAFDDGGVDDDDDDDDDGDDDLDELDGGLLDRTAPGGGGRSYFEAAAQRAAKPNLPIADDDDDDDDGGGGDAASLESELPPAAEGVDTLQQHYRREHFPRWLQLLRQGSNLLVVGLGSKQALLQEFALSVRGPTVLSVSGFNPQGGARALAGALVRLLPDQRKGAVPSLTSGNAADFAAALDAALEVDVLLVVHSLDGPGMRSPDALQALSEAGSRTHVRIVASMDHVNSALLFDSVLWHRFGWVIREASTFRSYSLERAFMSISEPRVAANGGLEGRVRAAVVLLSSLSSNARGLFRLIAQAGAEGITEQRLLALGRESFIVTNPVALRSALTEMRTHELVAIKRRPNGVELITLILDADQTKQVLAELPD